MKRFVDGIRQFQNDVFPKSKRRFQRLASGQKPLALFITCSDSRVDPNLLMQTEPGELFVLRNAGNLVPPYGAVRGGEDATIEYAVSVLSIRHVIVCGHSQCGAMSGLLNPEQVNGLTSVREWLDRAETTRRLLAENCADVECNAERLDHAVKFNVISQLDNLRTHPSVAAALYRDEMELHGWVYRFETGEVLQYAPHNREFVVLGQTVADQEPVSA
jgi:carbonic anhydrase